MYIHIDITRRKEDFGPLLFLEVLKQPSSLGPKVTRFVPMVATNV